MYQLILSQFCTQSKFFWKTGKIFHKVFLTRMVVFGVQTCGIDTALQSLRSEKNLEKLASFPYWGMETLWIYTWYSLANLKCD